MPVPSKLTTQQLGQGHGQGGNWSGEWAWGEDWLRGQVSLSSSMQLPSRPRQAGLLSEGPGALYPVTAKEPNPAGQAAVPSAGHTLSQPTLRLTDEGKMENETFPLAMPVPCPSLLGHSIKCLRLVMSFCPTSSFVSQNGHAQQWKVTRVDQARTEDQNSALTPVPFPVH